MLSINECYSIIYLLCCLCFLISSVFIIEMYRSNNMKPINKINEDEENLLINKNINKFERYNSKNKDLTLLKNNKSSNNIIIVNEKSNYTPKKNESSYIVNQDDIAKLISFSKIVHNEVFNYIYIEYFIAIIFTICFSIVLYFFMTPGLGVVCSFILGSLVNLLGTFITLKLTTKFSSLSIYYL